MIINLHFGAFDFVENYPFQIFKLLKKHTTIDSRFFKYFRIGEPPVQKPQRTGSFQKIKTGSSGFSWANFYIFRPGKYNFHAHTHTKDFLGKKLALIGHHS